MIPQGKYFQRSPTRKANAYKVFQLDEKQTASFWEAVCLCKWLGLCGLVSVKNSRPEFRTVNEVGNTDHFGLRIKTFGSEME
jgi:hypothetical protein